MTARARRRNTAARTPAPTRDAERRQRTASNDDGTLPPPSSNRGDVALLTPDPELVARALRALRGKGFGIGTAVSLAKLPTALPNDVLVIDMGDDRSHPITILDVLARVPNRPAVVIILRHPEDLRVAVQFSIGAVGVDAQKSPASSARPSGVKIGEGELGASASPLLRWRGGRRWSRDDR